MSAGASSHPLRRKNVVASVTIYVAHTDAMAVASVADDVLQVFAVEQLEPCCRDGGPVEFRKQLSGFAVVIEIHEEGELRRTAVVDLGLLPDTTDHAWVAQPDDIVREVTELHDVDPPVPINIDGQIAEVVDVSRLRSLSAR